MEKTPMEWVDKLFICMQEFYKERWEIYCCPNRTDLLKKIWQSALTGLTYDQIKSALVQFKRASLRPLAEPPHQLEFYRLANSFGEKREKEKSEPNPEIAKNYMQEIKRGLGMPCST